MGYKDLKRLENKTEEQKQFIETAEYHTQLISNDCEMNQICRHIENIDFEVKRKVRSTINFDYQTLMDSTIPFNSVTYELVKRKLLEIQREEYSKNNEKRKEKIKTDIIIDDMDCNKSKIFYEAVQNLLLESICNNFSELTNYLIVLFYRDKKSWSKTLLWKICGEQIFENCLQSCAKQIKVPVRQKDGEIRFCNDTFTVVQMNMNEEDQNDKDI